MLTRPDPWFTRPIRSSQDKSRRNARKAMIVLAARRRDREDVERYFSERARLAERVS